jgi:hypothetical protein
LEVTVPTRKPCDHAYSLKITGKPLKPVEVSYAAFVQPSADGSVLLEPEAADLHGSQIRVEERNGHSYIAAWDKASEWPSWTIQFPAKAAYEVSFEYSAAYQDTGFELALAGQKLTGTARKTAGWYAYQTLKLGRIEISDAGKRELTVRPADAVKWKAMNIRSIKLTKAE